MKSDKFNFRRFGEYFVLDLKTCIRKVGLSTLLCGLIPAMMLVMVAVMNLGMDEYGIWEIGNETKDTVTAIASVLYFLIVPISCYGMLTDRKEGSAAAMLPASHAEKYVSMSIISVIILPFAFCALYLGTDAALYGLFPERYEGMVAVSIASNMGISACDNNVTSLLTTFFMPWMVSSAGLTGAVLFKKGKGAKTFLTCSLSFILLVAIIGFTKTGSRFLNMDIHSICLCWILFQTFCAVCCLTYTYYRTKKIEL
ncbi:MAG: hypothetical protein ACI3ZL_07200 [Candidatus Cryptobacteroides sp.]